MIKWFLRFHWGVHHSNNFYFSLMKWTISIYTSMILKVLSVICSFRRPLIWPSKDWMMHKLNVNVNLIKHKFDSNSNQTLIKLQSKVDAYDIHAIKVSIACRKTCLICVVLLNFRLWKFPHCISGDDLCTWLSNIFFFL